MSRMTDEKSRLAAVLLRDAIHSLEDVIMLSDGNTVFRQPVKFAKESLQMARKARTILKRQRGRKTRT